VAAFVTRNLAAVLFAVRRESMCFRRRWRPFHHFPAAPCDARLCGLPAEPVLVLETGVGRAAVETALDWLLPTSPRFVLFAGFAGALDASLQVGDVLLADELIDPTGRRYPASWPGASTLRRGRLLTAAQLVSAPQDKRSLALRHEAHAVDMEAAFAACRCAQHHVPFGCVRAVSDTVDTLLSSSLLALLSGGRVSLARTLAAVSRRPALLRELWRLGRDTSLAAEQLAAALDELLASRAA
jgi:adenosylhomocysteine nucleosidase